MMITDLHVKNFALIESLKVEFGAGLNVFTGETGAGKSIIVDALGLLLGDKAQSSFVRAGAEKCEILGCFDVEKSRAVRKFLKEISVEIEGEPLIVRREIEASGKSKAFINDHPVSLAALSSLGSLLLEVHSQHEHQRLLKFSEQRDFLDRYAEAWNLRLETEAAWQEWKGLLERKQASQMSEQDRTQKIDLYSFQLKEIDNARLKAGEEEEMEKILPQLKNAEKIRVALDDSFRNLYEAEGSVSERLRNVKRQMEILGTLGADLKNWPSEIDEILMKADEVSREMEKLRDQTNSDPGLLDKIYGKQDSIAKLKKKYGTTIAEILAYRDKIKAELEAFENHAMSQDELEKEISKAHAKLLKAGKALTAARKKASEKLQAAVVKELKDLGFLKAKFTVSLVPEKDESGEIAPTAAGLEKVEFLLSANPGEEEQPLKAVASGGELSRIMLAFKKILAHVDGVPSLIFDEVDAGIGGSMGHVIGEKLKGLAKTHQVVAITHLPQVAAFASTHIAVRKEVAQQRTRTLIELLGEESRVEEIARMLGGVTSGKEKPTPASLKHASELIEAAANN